MSQVESTSNIANTTEEVAVEEKSAPKFQLIEGYQFPPFFVTENIKSALKYEAKPGNIFICTYPRSGTTWMQNILYLMVHKGEPLESGVSIDGHIPYLEKMGKEFAEQIPAPGILKTHLRWDLIPKNPEAKYIYVLRNPKDQVVSYYFHAVTQKTQGFVGDFNDYFEYYMNGATPYNDYFEHMLGWLPHLNEPNVLFVTYESLITDVAAGIKKIGHFLGGEYAQTVEDRSILESIVHHQDFKTMKANASRWRSPRSAAKGKSFMRKGEVGDWKNYLSEEQSRRLDEKYAEKTKGTPFEHVFDGFM
eukprot:TRINITY_DN519_c0_g1_i2.p1 TRINITY_DN519_c0_g1~~TRINITY_DN519_c0_g1_i2.p1  ORF type:complete len:352 (-),score=36.08 TRINITY_DN519_c0_g1_i2:353-1267(-)